MKIIDRYVLTTFVKNYLIAFMVLIGMYIALDMVFNLPNLTQTKVPNFSNLAQAKGAMTDISFGRVIYDICDFYFYQAFFFYVQLSGTITIIAASFTIMRLSRFNEMTAMLAAGTHLLRIVMAVIIAGAALNIILLPLDQEVLIPSMIPKLMREHNEVHQTTVKTFPVHMMQDDHDGLFNAAMYTPPIGNEPATVQYLDLIERKAELPVSHLYADEAVWNSKTGQWDLTNGLRVPIAPPNHAMASTNAVSVKSYKSDITPDEIALNLGKDYVQLLSTKKLDQLLSLKRYGKTDLLRTKHLRWAQWGCNLILLLMTVASVLTREPGALKASLLKCVGVSAACMATVFVTYQLAGSPPEGWRNLWPALMAWIPIFIFGPISVYMLDHVKS